LLLGESEVGKSCLLKRFVEDQFKESSFSTIGVDFQCKKISVGNHHVKLQIWDTAGQERYRSITASYYRKCSGILLVFDVTEPDSFKTVESKYIKEIVLEMPSQKQRSRLWRDLCFCDGISNTISRMNY
jgi:Ras-related protein Rab-1A